MVSLEDIFGNLLAFHADPSLERGTQLVELSIWAYPIDLIFNVHFEESEAHLTGQCPSWLDLEVNLCSLEELLGDVKDWETVFIVDNHLHAAILEHSEAVPSSGHEGAHCHGIFLGLHKVAPSECYDVTREDPLPFRLFGVENELEVGNLRESALLGWVFIHSPLKSFLEDGAGHLEHHDYVIEGETLL